MAQDYFEGEVYENLIKEIFNFYSISITVYSYKDFPDLQNSGIDASIVSPSQFEGTTLQVKMFRNSEKYQTFPWEVSRYLVGSKEFVIEPHASDFHVIIDPIINDQIVNCTIWIIKTGTLPSYFSNTWLDAINIYGTPSHSNDNWLVKEGRIEPYFFKIHKNESLYQLIKKHTASQRNIRFRLDRLQKNYYKFKFNIPLSMLNLIERNQYLRCDFKDILCDMNFQNPDLNSYFRNTI